MTPAKRQHLIEEAFLLGFMVSREGFNGECAYEHCADDALQTDAGQTEAEWRDLMAGNEAFKRLRALAVKRLAEQGRNPV